MQATSNDMKSPGRLKRRSDFLRVQGKGRKWVAPTMVVYWAAGQDGQTETRFGLTITKKTEKRAVDRNRIRRRLRAAACEVLAGHPDLTGTDLVLIGRPATRMVPYDKITGDLRWCLKRLLRAAAEEEKGKPDAG